VARAELEAWAAGGDAEEPSAEAVAAAEAPVDMVEQEMAEDAAPAASVAHADKGTREIVLAGSPDPILARIVARDGMAAGSVVTGPAIIEQSDTTTLVEPGWQAAVAPNGILIVTRTA